MWHYMTLTRYTTHAQDNPREYNYWHDKPQYDHAGKYTVANYVVLSVTLYVAGIGTPTIVDGNMQSATEEKPHQAALPSTLHSHYVLF